MIKKQNKNHFKNGKMVISPPFPFPKAKLLDRRSGIEGGAAKQP
jgi:hypothetical protein